MSHNRIHFVARKVFSNSKFVTILDMSWNFITFLYNRIFSGVHSLKFLNLTWNPILRVSGFAFFNVSLISIATENYRVCCNKPSTICQAKPSWPNSCTRLFEDHALKVFIWTVNCLGFILSFCSGLVVWLKKLPSGDSYNCVILCLSASDMLHCTSILIIVSANEIFAHDHLKYRDIWKTSFLCYFSSVLYIIPNYLSLFMINLLTLTRYFVVKNPIESKFNESNFLMRLCIVFFILISLIALSIGLCYFYITENSELPSELCLLIGGYKNSILSYTLTISTICVKRFRAQLYQFYTYVFYKK